MRDGLGYSLWEMVQREKLELIKTNMSFFYKLYKCTTYYKGIVYYLFNVIEFPYS